MLNFVVHNKYRLHKTLTQLIYPSFNEKVILKTPAALFGNTKRWSYYCSVNNIHLQIALRVTIILKLNITFNDQLGNTKHLAKLATSQIKNKSSLGFL